MIDWSLNGENWNNIVTLQQNQGYSNAQNSGYFYFELPSSLNWENFELLKIKFTALTNNPQGKELSIYLDSIWLEAIYEEEKKVEEPEIALLTFKKDFEGNEEPEFQFHYKKINEGFLASVGEALNLINYWENINTSVRVINSEGETLEILPDFVLENNGEFLLKIRKPKGFKPGLYKIILRIEEQGNVQELERDFSWGVLAINTNKSIYLPGEEAYLQMAALMDNGHTICDANLKLEIISPEGWVTSPEVQMSEECGPNNVIDKPDYFAYYQIAGTGVYEIKLTNLDNGYEVTDQFETRDLVPFDVERVGPTRIYPLADYEMTLKIKANQDFSGQVIEQIPASFEIEETNYGGSTSIVQEEKSIVWDVQWKAGESYELEYTFDAPDVSPYFYLLGPLKLTEAWPQTAIFEEARQWQIASDATTTYNFTSGGGTNKWFYKKMSEATHPPASGPAITDETEVTSYTEIESSNDIRYETNGDRSDSATHHFKFDIAESSSTIYKMEVKWEGHTVSKTSYLYIWNFSGTPSWEVVGSHANKTADQEITKIYTSDFSNYIDASGYLHLVATHADLAGDTANLLKTDYVEVKVHCDVEVTTVRSQVADLAVPSTNECVGTFVIKHHIGSCNVTGITITEQGTVNAQTNLDNIKIFYEFDTTTPYDCASEDYGGSESQFGSTDTDGFSGANGTSTFTGSSAAISTTQSMCVYVVLDVGSSAADGETLEIQITTPASDVTLSSGTASPDIAVLIPGTTTLTILPDFYLNSSDIVFSDKNPEANEEIAISATVRNSGGSHYGQIFTDQHWDKENDSAIISGCYYVYSTTDTAQSFIPSYDFRLSRVALNFKTYGTSGTLTIKIQGDSGNLPDDSNVIATATFQPTSGPATYTWYDFEFSTIPTLSNGTKYWIVAEGTGTSTTNCWCWTADVDTGSDFPDNNAAQDGGSGWVALDSYRDCWFRAYKEPEILVKFYDGDPDGTGNQIGSAQEITNLISGITQTVQVNWTPTSSGSYDIYVHIDRDGNITEGNENNNKNSKSISVLTFNQTTYRWYDNANNVQPGSAKADPNIEISGVADNEIIRARISNQVQSANLLAQTQSLKLQYAQMQGAACGGGDETWYDMDSITSTSWYDTNWLYRKKIPISGSSGAGADYQIKIKVGESNGASNYDFHLEGNCQPDFDDVRFADDNGTTLLDYWLEKTEGTTPNQTATFWVEVKDNLDSLQNIYIYYEHSTIGSASNGDNTFIFFDDFPDAAINGTKWTSATVGNGSITVADSLAKLHNSGDPSEAKITTNNSFAFGNITEIKAKIKTGNNDYTVIGLKDTDNYLYQFVNYAPAWEVARKYFQLKKSGTSVNRDLIIAFDTWYEIKMFSRGNFAEYWQGDTLIHKETYSSYCPSSTATAPILLQAHGFAPAITDHLQADWVKVRKYAYPEPEIGTSESQESTTTQATLWKGDNSNTTPSDGDPITSSLLDSQSNALESYEEENCSVANPAEITSTSKGEWDWVIKNNGAPDSTAYCFRMIEDDGVSFTTYTNYPKLTTSGVGIIVSGVAYTDEGSNTLNTSGGAIKLVNSTTGDTFSDSDGTDASGNWSISVTTTPSAGDVLTIWIDGASADGTLVFKYGDGCAGGNCTGLHLYQNRVIIRNEHTVNVTNADLADCDNDTTTTGTECEDTEIGFTSDLSGTYNLVVSDTRKLYVWTTDTFEPGGTVTTSPSNDGTDTNVNGDLLIQSGAALSMGANALSIGGDYTNYGTFSKSSGQDTSFTATASGFEITENIFEDAIFSGSNGGWSFTDSAIINGNLTMTAGTLSNTSNLTVKGGTADGSGILTFSDGTHLANIKTISAGAYHTCAVSNAGNAYCWGSDGNGRLGDGGTTEKSVPQRVHKGEAASGDFDTDWLANVKSISAGGYHTCAVSNAGNAYCWGEGGNGRLGDGGTTEKLVPQRVHKGEAASGDFDTDWLANVKSISAGDYHTCAVSNAGNAYCWGYALYGQLGDGQAETKSVPQRVHKGEAASSDFDTDWLANVKSISAGAGYESGKSHTCAVSYAGNAYCWGESEDGRLGDGQIADDKSVPQRVHKGEAVSGDYDSTETWLANVKSISAGSYHTCAVSNAGNTYCWGDALYGQLGDGQKVDKSDPQRVHQGEAVSGDYDGTHLANIKIINAGNGYTCAVSNAGNPYCWGAADNGRLGNGQTSGDYTTPVRALKGEAAASDIADMDLLGDVKPISAGGHHTCAVSNAGNAYCWGVAGNGRLGDGQTTTDKSIPQRAHKGEAATSDTAVADFFNNIKIISAGGHHTCAVSNTNNAYCWGMAANGRLGDGQTTVDKTTPVRVLKGEAVIGDHDGINLTSVKTISARNGYTCAVSNADNIYCWGDGADGRLGDGQTADKSVPQRVHKGEAASGDYDADWLANVKNISTANAHTCAVSNASNAYCWGYAGYGQLGDGQETETPQTTPQRVHKGEAVTGDFDTDWLANVQSIAAGANHSCAVSHAGNAYCWGYAGNGRLGDGQTAIKSIPQRVHKGEAVSGDYDTDWLINVKSISADYRHTCAVSHAGNAYCWGYALDGRLGDGQETDKTVPQRVHKGEAVSGDYDTDWLANAKSISTGYHHTCAVSNAGNAYCWGYPANGRLGDGQTTLDKTTPVRVLKGEAVTGDHDNTNLTNIKTIIAGYYHGCAWSNADNAYCWGVAGNGQLGDGQISDKSVPQRVHKGKGEESVSDFLRPIFTLISSGNFGGSNAWTFVSLSFGDGSTSGTSASQNSGAISVSNLLIIESSHILNAGSKTWTLSGSGTPFTNKGTFTASTSTVAYEGTSATTITALTGSNKYNNLTIGNVSDNNTVTYTSGGNTDVGGNFLITSSGTGTHTFVAPSSLAVAGNWTNNDAFTHNSGTVNFNGAGAQTINSSNSWYDLSITTSTARTITFESDVAITQTIVSGGSLTLTGISGQLLTLAPSAPTTQWLLNLNAAATESISYVSVSYSNANSGDTIQAADGTNDNGGNNENWNFGVGITVSGVAYTDEGSNTLNTSGGAIKLVNSTTGVAFSDSNGTDASGNWSISVTTTPSAGDVLTIWINGATGGEKGTIVLKYGDGCTGGDCTGLHLYQNRVIIRNEHTGSVTNANLADCDNNSTTTGIECTDAQIGFTSDLSGTYNLVVSDTRKLYVWTTDTFEPGGTVTTSPSNDGTDTNVDGDIHIEGTGILTMGANALSVGGDFYNEGTFNKTNPQTTTFTATATGHTITDGGENFDTIIFNGTNGGWSFADSTIIDVDLTMTAGTLSGTNDITAKGDVKCGASCGTISLTSASTFKQSVGTSKSFGPQIVGANNWTFYNLIFDSSAGTPTITFNGTNTGTFTVSNDLTLTNTGTSLAVDNNTNNRILDINNDVSIGAGVTFSAAPSAAFTVGGSWTNSGAFTHGSGTVTFDAVDAGHTVNAGSSSFSNVIFSGVSGEWSPLTNTMTIIGDLTMTNGIFNTTSGTANVTANGDVKCGASCGVISMTTTNTFKQSVGTSKSFGPQIAGADNWIFYNLIFDSSAGTPTITFNGTNTGTFTVSNDLTLTNTGTSLAVDNNTNNRILDINNDVSIGAGVTFSAAPSAAFTIGGSWTNSGAFTHGSGTVTFDAAADTKTLSGTLNGSSAFHNLTFGQTSGTATWNLSSALEVNNDLTIDFGTLGQGAHNINLDKNLAINANGNFTSGTGIFIFDGTTGPYTWTNAAAIDDLGAVEINGTTLVINLGSSVKAASVNIYVSQTLSANGSNTLTLTGSGTPLTRGGTFTASTGTVEYTSGSGVTALASAAMTGSNAFNNLIINGTGTFTLGVDIESGNDLTVTSGTLAGTNNVTAKGNITGAGTVTLTSGTFEQIVALNKTFGSSSGANNWTFNNLKFNNSDGAATRAITPNAGTGDIIISGTLTLGDSGTQTITFDNETSNDRVFDINGSILISSQGIFSASSTASFRVAANFTNNGTFTANSGTVTFDTTGISVLDGSGTPAITFHNFTSTTAGKTLKFTATKTFQINGNFLIQGADSNQIIINSTTTTQWLINHQGTEDVTYAHISNSGCAGSSTNISLENTSTDGGNNGSCWLFPSLSFTLDAASKSLDLNSVNTFTATATTTLTVSTTATFGYNLTAYETDNMRHTAYSSVTISDWAGTNAVPTVWTGTCIDNTQCGWGYNTGDADLTQFAANEYAGFVGSSQAPGDIVAKSTAPVTNDATTITYRASVLATQSAGPYKTTIIYIVTPEF